MARMIYVVTFLIGCALAASAAGCWWTSADTMAGMEMPSLISRLTGLPCDLRTTIGLITGACLAWTAAALVELWHFIIMHRNN